jgi:hypothetical protein
MFPQVAPCEPECPQTANIRRSARGCLGRHALRNWSAPPTDDYCLRPWSVQVMRVRETHATTHWSGDASNREARARQVTARQVTARQW